MALSLGALAAASGAFQGANQQEDTIRQHEWQTQQEAQQALLNNPQAHPGQLLSVINSTTGGIDPKMIGDYTAPNYFQGWKYVGPTKGIKTKDLVSGDNWVQLNAGPGGAAVPEAVTPDTPSQPAATPSPIISKLVNGSQQPVTPGAVIPPSPGNAPTPQVIPPGAGQSPSAIAPAQAPNPGIVKNFITNLQGNRGASPMNPAMPNIAASQPQAQAQQVPTPQPGGSNVIRNMVANLMGSKGASPMNPALPNMPAQVSQAPMPGASPQVAPNAGAVAPIATAGTPTPPGVVGPIPVAGASAPPQASPVIQRLLSGSTALPTMSDALGLPPDLAKYQMLTQGRKDIADENNQTKRDIAANSLTLKAAQQGDKDAIAIGRFAQDHPDDPQDQAAYATSLGRTDLAQDLLQNPIGATYKDQTGRERADAYTDNVKSLAGLRDFQGKYIDAKTGDVVPDDQAKRRLEESQADYNDANTLLRRAQTTWLPKLDQNLMDYRTTLGQAAGENAQSGSIRAGAAAQVAQTGANAYAFNVNKWNTLSQGEKIKYGSQIMTDLQKAQDVKDALLLKAKADGQPTPDTSAIDSSINEMNTYLSGINSLPGASGPSPAKNNASTQQPAKGNAAPIVTHDPTTAQYTLAHGGSIHTKQGIITQPGGAGTPLLLNGKPWAPAK